MLDDLRVIQQRDARGALDVIANQWEQAKYDVDIKHWEHDGRRIEKIIVAGMGGSALAALIIKNWLESEIDKPIDVIRNYNLPAYANENTLVICSSYSGNTEETLSCLDDAIKRGCQIAITTSGGKLKEIADERKISLAELPSGLQPRMALIYNLRTTLKLMAHFGAIDYKYFDQVGQYSDWLRDETAGWKKDVDSGVNPAKQIALLAVGKTSIFYASHTFAPLAYKWKISWNETSKNLAFCNEMPEFNHNEFMGWASHPVQKPYAVFDFMSQFDHSQIKKRFTLSDRLLSGRRPKAHVINLQGDSVIAQMLWGCILADFASVYVAILNGVDPTPVALIEKLKKYL